MYHDIIKDHPGRVHVEFTLYFLDSSATATHVGTVGTMFLVCACHTQCIDVYVYMRIW